MHKKYCMEQGHYNPKIRVMKINDKNGPYVTLRTSSFAKPHKTKVK